MFSRRTGWYYLRATAPIQVGTSGTLYFKQKIHSSHPEFNKINPKYIQDGYLRHENLIPFGERNQYVEFTGGINPPKYVEEPKVVVEEKQEVIQQKETYLVEPQIEESVGPEEIKETEQTMVEEEKVIEESIEEVIVENETEEVKEIEDENKPSKKRSNKKKK